MKPSRKNQGATGRLRGVAWLGTLAVFLVVLCASARPADAAPFTASTGAELAPRSTRDIVDQIFNRLADRITYGAGGAVQQGDGYDQSRYWPVSTSPWRQNQHPLPRRSPIENGAEEGGRDSALRKKRQVAPQVPAPAPPADAPGAAVGAGTAQPSASASFWDDEEEADSGGGGGGASAAGSAPTAATVGAPRVGAVVTGSANPASETASEAASASASPSSAAASASASSASASSASPSSAATPSKTASPSSSAPSSSRPTPSATDTPKDKQQADPADDEEQPGLLSPKNKLFPLVVVGISAAVILALLLFIAIARAVAHDKMRRDAIVASKRGPGDAYGSSKEKGDRLTSAAPGMSAARSIRRAITRKKLGSFARRTQDNSVLIDVGDEVFAVPAHLAESYRNEMIRERKMGSSSASGSKESITDGPFGKIRPKHLTGGGPDVEGWRARLNYDEQVNGSGGATRSDGKPNRTLSQRIADRFKAMTQSFIEEEPELEQEHGDGRPTARNAAGAFSFDAANQPRGAMRQADLSSQVPVLTHGSSDWQIRPSNSDAMANVAAAQRQHKAGNVPRKPVSYPAADRKSIVPDASILSDKLSDLEKQVQSSSSHKRRRRPGPPPASQLSHERITLSDGPSPSSSSNGHGGGSGMGTYAGSDSHLSSDSSNRHGHAASSGYTPSDSSAAVATAGHAPRRDEEVNKSVEVNKVEIKRAQRAMSIHPVAVSSGTYRHRKAQHPSHQLIADRVNQSHQQRQKPSIAAATSAATTRDVPRSKSQHASSASARPPAVSSSTDRNQAASKPTLQRGQSTTAAASPDLYRSRRYSAADRGDGRAALTLRPEQPPRAAFLKGLDNVSSRGIDAIRPLPVPPQLSPFAP
ncbi:uncharacterized protein PSFLO_03669 [Pseudozyma flocculosa]|uniref:Uncharacterized protein n=1 Tax=Pseudozyma flocculosa TaxID=84751 RepID=A0A5C3F1M8_9BASI|nr:uncharacterized protein PSFLO_03669 [Pseudozyma flocculosa]